MNRKTFGIALVCLGSLGGCLGGEDPSQGADALLVSPPRRTAPLAGATVSSQRPLVRWATLAPAGLRVEFCADRDCSLVEQSVRASGRSARAAEGLSPGLHFWRLSVRGRTTSAVSRTTTATASPTSPSAPRERFATPRAPRRAGRCTSSTGANPCRRW